MAPRKAWSINSIRRRRNQDGSGEEYYGDQSPWLQAEREVRGYDARTVRDNRPYQVLS